MKAQKSIRDTVNNLIAIHHVGSTSVPVLLAKPKIDIITVVKNPVKATKICELIAPDIEFLSMLFSDEGERIIAGSPDNGVKIWDFSVFGKLVKEGISSPLQILIKKAYLNIKETAFSFWVEKGSPDHKALQELQPGMRQSLLDALFIAIDEEQE